MQLVLLFLLVFSLTTHSSENVPVLSARLNEVQYPFPVYYLPVKNQQQTLEMAYMDVKPKHQNGKTLEKTVLLLHGKNFSGLYWQDTIRQLIQNGYRVIVPDQVGFGKSSKPKTFQYSFQQLASNTLNLLDHLGVKKVIVVGHSMGGMLASRFALMFPERTKALVLENPIGLEDWKRYVSYRTIDQIYAAELAQTREHIKTYQQENYYHGTWRPEYDQWVDLIYGQVKSPDYPLVAWNSALVTDMIFNQAVLYEFPDLKMPTLLIIGQLDRTAIGKTSINPGTKYQLGNYPALGKQAAAAIPNAKLIPLEGIGHTPHLENPQAFYDALLPFLETM